MLFLEDTKNGLLKKSIFLIPSGMVFLAGVVGESLLCGFLCFRFLLKQSPIFY
ncbi:hypothetical protein MBAV_000239 [Candidatus Magnetobacterium bavaricum]|uniref:Uncharacterized protein n=1 Tax=Candidatus Magnetobacterium bavaricum TaxID=29290 RepID=A0A0F3GYA3_9BACT|nr:hypothetical protein MBAV_002114 [Candidatus Magnetobacterium bavaricum]KJU87562.1 hypothetical protein MBAV_000239 [Candidatus Magnetobacterium bavaricum]